MNTFSLSVTFLPFVKGMPAFLHNFIYLDFGADCSDYYDFHHRSVRKAESKSHAIDGLKQAIHKQ